ncbi:MAG: hypothetical protein GEV08_05410 [Acidimicrobiia bacterium]|nr:hypothetical protein [Acidimicrobiia bacterium]
MRPGYRFTRDVFGGHPVHLSETPGRADVAGPALGEHTAEVLGEVAGYSPAEVDELVAAGAAYLPVEPGCRLQRRYDAYLGALGLVEP